MSTADLLFELGTEELPAGEIDSMVTALYEGILNGLKDEGLPFAEAQYFSTPRRLAVLVKRGCGKRSRHSAKRCRAATVSSSGQRG